MTFRPSMRPLRLLVALDRSRRHLAAAADAERECAAVLAESQAFHRAVLDGVDVGIVTTDIFGNVSFANRAARDLLRVSAGKGGDVRDLLGLSTTPEELVATTPALTYTITRRDGVELELELSVHRATGPERDLGFFFVLRDVREEKTRSTERARFERLAAIGTMVAGFAHEVRNPVAALRSLAESLAEELADAQLAAPQVSRMLKVLERIERLVRTSLQFGRPAAPRRGCHRPWALLASAISVIGPRTRALGDDVRLEVDPDLPDVFVDETQLVQVLVILLDNALDAVGSARRVLVRVVRGHDDVDSRTTPVDRREGSLPPPSRTVVRFEVHDDGAGIPAEIIERIFDPFFTTKAAGTGLGLSIAQHVVSENGGSLEVSSERGGPTTFSIVLAALEPDSSNHTGSSRPAIDEPS